MGYRSFILLLILVSSTILANAQNEKSSPGNNVASQQVPPDAAVSGGYMLGPGDQVAGRVLGESAYDFVATVDENGMIEVPFVKKPVVAQCRTERELRAELTDILKVELRDPRFSFRIIEKHSRPSVRVAGEIMKQMEVTLYRKATLVEVLTTAGGPKDEASGDILVIRPKPPLCMAENDPDNWKANSNDPKDVPFRTFSFANLSAGKEDSNPVIYPGDVIILRKAPPIYITGMVVGAQGVYLKENGLALTEAISMVGGPRPEADRKKVTILRLKPGSSPESRDRDIISADLDLIRQGRQKDLMMRPYDIVVVDKAKESVWSTVAGIAMGAARTGISSISSAGIYAVIY